MYSIEVIAYLQKNKNVNWLQYLLSYRSKYGN